MRLTDIHIQAMRDALRAPGALVSNSDIDKALMELQTWRDNMRRYIRAYEIEPEGIDLPWALEQEAIRAEKQEADR